MLFNAEVVVAAALIAFIVTLVTARVLDRLLKADSRANPVTVVACGFAGALMPAYCASSAAILSN
jgi:hypothetical protein